MDAAIITLEPCENQQTKVEFAGAKRPLWYIMPDSSQLEEAEGSRISIGTLYRRPRKFEAKSFVFEPGTLLYLCSDGFADQNNIHHQRFGNEGSPHETYL